MEVDEYGPPPPNGGIDIRDPIALVAPMGEARFMADYWERRPLLARGRGDGLRAILDLGMLDALVATRQLRPSDLRVAKGHKLWRDPGLFAHGVADKQRVLDAIGQGCTLVFDQVDRHVPALARLLHAWESRLGLPARANAYLTPRASSGFDRHFDIHDVISVQLHGTKVWDVCDAPLPLPHEEQFEQSAAAGKSARLLARIEMRPGDVLYLPRGQVHAAAAQDEASLHVSVSIRNLPLRDVAIAALRARLLAMPEFRRSLHPLAEEPARIRRALEQLPAGIDLPAALQRAAQGFERRRRDPFPGSTPPTARDHREGGTTHA